jgi:hypothetical protein
MKTSFRLPSLLSITALAIALFASAHPASAQNVIANGGFESGTSTSAPPWVLTDLSNNSNFGSNSVFANSGTRYANLGAEATLGTLTQSFNTVPGVSYTLSFFLAHDVTIAPSNQFSVAFNGTVIPGSTLTNVGTFGYTNFTFSGLVATSSTSTLEFRFTDNDDFFRLDDVSVVPEPSTYALLIAGGMLGLVQYRRNQRRRAAAQA